MKRIWVLCFLWIGTNAWGQEVLPTATVPPLVVKPITHWNAALVPWDDWFRKNNIVTDKTEYVHFFWNAQDMKVDFEVKDKKVRFADAALQLVSRLYPKSGKADWVKVDIVYVLERNSYGEPKWDSLQQVAHFEFLRSKTRKFNKHKGTLTEAQLNQGFTKIEIY